VITNSSNMSDEEIRRAVEDAERYRQEDMKKRQELDIKNKAEQLIVDAESIKKRLTKEDRQRLDPMIHSLKKALKGGNLDEIQRESDEFARVLSSIGFSFDGNRSANDDGTYDSNVD
ncbi:MAG: Hsp70 family protein, partial [Clostridia bacterium]|nr:Hsp70 family protein [Clostridia bacterium]